MSQGPVSVQDALHLPAPPSRVLSASLPSSSFLHLSPLQTNLLVWNPRSPAAAPLANTSREQSQGESGGESEATGSSCQASASVYPQVPVSGTQDSVFLFRANMCLQPLTPSTLRNPDHKSPSPSSPEPEFLSLPACLPTGSCRLQGEAETDSGHFPSFHTEASSEHKPRAGHGWVPLLVWYTQIRKHHQIRGQC